MRALSLRSRRGARGVLAAFGAMVLTLLASATASAQDAWLGLEIRFEIEEVTGAEPSRTETLVIDDVVPDSPAASADIEVGDVLVEIYGSPASQDELLRLERDLEPGDPVDLVLSRDGERVAVTLEAAEAPDDIRRRRLTILNRRRGGAQDRTETERELRLELEVLERELQEINRERLENVRMRMDSVLAEFDEERMLELEEQLTRSREAFEAARRAQREALAIQARVRAGVPRAIVLPDSVSYRIDPDSFVVEIPEFRGVIGSNQFYSPVLWGRNVVAGAELTELNPSLARYFDVEEGVLVTDVTERSPAADGGMEPGDVIVEVEGEPVSSVDDVREMFSRLTFPGGVILIRPSGPDRDEPDDEPVSVTVVREGARLDLELRE